MAVIVLADLVGLWLSAHPMTNPLFFVAELIRELRGENPIIVDRGEAAIGLVLAPIGLLAVLLLPMAATLALWRLTGFRLRTLAAVPLTIWLLATVLNVIIPGLPMSRIFMPFLWP